MLLFEKDCGPLVSNVETAHSLILVLRFLLEDVFACMYVCHVHAVLWKPKEGIMPLKLELQLSSVL